MYRLLIVDDEPYITDGLVELFTGLDYLELDVYCAYSSAQALNWMKKVKIDIVLTDICMPEMDGLALQKEVNSRWPRCRVIFLTAHSDFEYVKSAMLNNFSDYVLKTEGDAAIIKAVRKAIKEIDNEINNENILRKAKEDIERVMPILRKEYLLDLLHGAEISPKEHIEFFEQAQMELSPEQPVLLLIGHLDKWGKCIRIVEKNHKLYELNNIVNEYLGISVTLSSCVYEGTAIVWFIQPRLYNTADTFVNDWCNETWQRTISFVHGTLDSIQEKCRELTGISLSFIADSQQTEWNKLYERFNSMMFMLDQGFNSGGEIIIAGDKRKPSDELVLPYSTTSPELKVDLQLKKLDLLKSYLSKGEHTKFFDIYDQIMGSLKEIKQDNRMTEMEVFYSLAALFITFINRWNLWGRLKEDIDLSRLTRFEDHSSFDDFSNYFRELAYLILQYRSDSQATSTNQIISLINRYIEENIGGDLSLVRLAELVYFNPVYLSRLYKQVTGKNLMDYITEVKFNKCIELLKQKDKKIHEIASDVGFKTPSYFTRFFKKLADMTPQEFRDTLFG